MKAIVLIGMLISFSIWSQPIEKQTIKQDVAVRHIQRKGFTDEKIEAIILENNQPVAITERSAYKWDGKNWNSTRKNNPDKMKNYTGLPNDAGNLLSSATFNGKDIAGTENGLYWSDAGKNNWEMVLPRDEKYRWAPLNVSALVVDTKGRLWFGAEQGVGCFHNNKWKLYSGDEGLPFNRFTGAAAGPDGIVWFGTEKGAIRFENGEFYYRFSIAPNELEIPYDTASFKHGISDNDGKYTSMYGAAQAYRYAITGEKEAKDLAKRSFEACKWLVDITHEPGFPARVIVPHDWPEPLADPEYTHQMNLRAQQNDPFWKDITPRFIKSKNGKYLWKCDTSSDELAGHYFFYGIYYDLVAETEEEKSPVDLIGYEMDNTHRLDVEFDPTPGQESTIGWRKDGFALPIDERGHVRQDRDGFALHFKEVGGVNAEQEGTFYLLPYYRARYNNLIK